MLIMEKIKVTNPKIGKKQVVEFGLVAVLVVCVFALWFNAKILIFIAIVACLITLFVPLLFYPFAFLWFALSAILSKISTAVLLGLVYYLILTPMGLFRKFFGHDTLRLKQFKKGTQSVMIDRDHTYTAEDMADSF